MINYLFIFLSSLGLMDAGFLTVQHYTKDPFTCPLFGGCEQVTSSSYSEIFGVPVALLGILYYGTIFAASLYVYFTGSKKVMLRLAQLTLIGFLFSLVLIYLQVFVIGAICFYCMLSATSSILLFIIGARYLYKNNYLIFGRESVD